MAVFGLMIMRYKRGSLLYRLLGLSGSLCISLRYVGFVFLQFSAVFSFWVVDSKA